MAYRRGLSHVVVLRSIRKALRVARQPCSVGNAASARLYCRVTVSATFVVTYYRPTSCATVSSTNSACAGAGLLFWRDGGPGGGCKAEGRQTGKVKTREARVK